MYLWYVLGGVPRWNQAGSWDFRFLDIFMGAKLMLNFLAVLSMSTSSGGSPRVRGPCVGGFQVCRKRFISFGDLIPSGFRLFIRVSAMKAQAGRCAERSRNGLSHVISMAWL